ncbi:hypothetical protein [Paratractidigestivibacter sp.]|uniref:hypothetical protein n=1 Tax=Paratractidigestivibacter sp. TaxID=2847316 RepID=UPI002ACB07F4|nr:hypothetical protein [Paratractidigestivibacter sp.]
MSNLKHFCETPAQKQKVPALDTLANLGAFLLLTFSTLFLAVAFSLSFACTGLIYDPEEETQTLSWLFSADWPAPASGILCAAVFLAVLLLLGEVCSRCSEMAVFTTVMVITTAFSVWWVVRQNAVDSGFADSQRLLAYASSAAKGDWSLFVNEGAATLSNLDGNAYVYFSYYPYQCGIFCYFYLIYKLVGDFYAFLTLQLINVAFNELSLALVYAMGRTFLKTSESRTRLALLLLFCLPMQLSAGFVYGNSIGFGFGVLFLYLQLRALLAKSMPSRASLIGLSFVPLALMMIIKSTFILFGIAAAIAWLYAALKERNPLPLILLCICIVISSRLSVIPTRLVETKTGNDFGDGMPKISWIMLGTETSENCGMAGWWDTRAAEIYVKSGGEVSKQSQMATEQLVSNISGFASDPLGCVTFFAEKLASEWAEPTFCSVTYSNFNIVRYTNDYYDAYGALGATSPGGVWTSFMDGYQLVIYGLALVAFVGSFAFGGTHDLGRLLFAAVFFTGFGCYLLWEAKSVYVMPFFYLLMPFSAAGADRLCFRRGIGR